MTAHFCPGCGEPVRPDAHFCVACGHHFVEGPAAAAAVPAPPAPAAPAPPSAPQATAAGHRQRNLIVAGVAAVLLLVIGVVAVLVLTGDEAEAEVLLEPTGIEVPDPFTATVALGEAPLSATTTTRPPSSSTSASTSTTAAPDPGAGGGAVAGSAPGLYGGTRDTGSCDAEKVIAFLQSEPDKAAAWAGVHDIEVSAIPTYVRGLTPVILRRDTRVLNHGYRDGRATPRPAVLQAGTAVLVDRFGIPRVKCGCGNPLADALPVTTRTTYTGTRWPGFDPEQVVVVRGDVAVDVFVLVDLRTGDPFRRPSGSKGDDDTEATASTSTTTTTRPTTTTTPPASEGTSAPILFEIGNVGGVQNGPTAPSVADLPAARITALTTYHWNDARGAAPGTIGLRAEDGTLYGPFPATGTEGQGGVPDAGWVAVTNFTVPAGRYTVVDSDPASWAQNAESGGRGFVGIHGIAASTPTTRTPNTQPPTTASAPDRTQEAIDAVQGRLCGQTPGIDEDWRQYITSITATETDFELYRVDVRIDLDSGGWDALFDVDFATEGGPEIRPVNSESADLLC